MRILLLTVFTPVMSMPIPIDIKVDVPGTGIGVEYNHGDIAWKFPGRVKDGKKTQEHDDGSVCSTAAEMWQSDELASWMLKLSPQFKKYAEAVKAEAIDAKMFLELKEEDFEDEPFQIKSKFHMKRLVQEREKLRTEKVCINDFVHRQLENKFKAVGSDLVKAAKKNDFTGGEVATDMWGRLQDAGLEISQPGQLLGEDLEKMLTDMTENALGLEALEWRSHEILGLSYCRPGVPCIADDVKELLVRVMDAKQSVKLGYHKIRAGSAQLTNGITNFRLILQRPDCSPAMESQETQLLNETFQGWQASAKEVMKDLKSKSHDLLSRAKKQTASLKGGQAVQTAYETVQQITTEIESAAKNRTRILQEDKVKLAYDAHRGKLAQKVTFNHETIDRIEARLTQLESLRQQKENVSLQALKNIFALGTKKQAHLDWHYSWSNMFGRKIDSYSNEVSNNIKEQERLSSDAEKARATLDEAINECQEKLQQYRQDEADVKYATSNSSWILETEGLFDAERTLLRLQRQRKEAQDILDSAMKEAGIPDATTAAKILTKSQESLMLISSVSLGTMEIAEKVAGYSQHFDNLLSRFAGKAHADSAFLLPVLTTVEQSFKVIQDAYDGHMSQITAGGQKAQMIESYAKKLLPAPSSSSDDTEDSCSAKAS